MIRCGAEMNGPVLHDTVDGSQQAPSVTIREVVCATASDEVCVEVVGSEGVDSEAAADSPGGYR